ncbi:unnamed protein product, partial [Sphacelaria rigidula]
LHASYLPPTSPCRKHRLYTYVIVAIFARFALHNLKFGSTEHGRAIYECLLQAYPERLDVWKEYFEAEAEKGGTQVARNLLQKLVSFCAYTYHVGGDRV